MRKIRFEVLTLFPEIFEGYLKTSVIGSAHKKGIVTTNMVNFRDFTLDRHRTVDDEPYGGGSGMVLKVEPIVCAVESLLGNENDPTPIILLSPQGKPFTQEKAQELSLHSHLILICGHYEGFDERIREHVVTEEISIGDYVLTGGELPAMVVMDSVTRLVPGVLGNKFSAEDDSFSKGLLEYPQYTRPSSFRGYTVPEILLSGHHENIAKWRYQEALKRTWLRRPDLLDNYSLSQEDQDFLEGIKKK